MSRTRRMRRHWLGRSTPLELAGWPGAARLVDEDSAGACVLGVVRPTLLVSRRVADLCTSEELAGVVAHERAHAAARDNWSRLLLRVMPDLVGLTPIAAQIERMWRARAEEEADLAAVRGNPAARGAIAAALVKLARCRLAAGLPLAAGFDPAGSIERRVRLLLHRDSLPPAGAPRRARQIAQGLILAAALVLGLAPGSSKAVHAVTEALVRLLS